MILLPVVARDPYKADDDEKALKIFWFDNQFELSHISRSLHSDDGFEFQLESTIAQFHGKEFADKYALALVNDSSTFDITLERLTTEWFVSYCESRFQEVS